MQNVGVNVRTAKLIGDDLSNTTGAGGELDVACRVGLFLTVGSCREFTLDGR